MRSIARALLKSPQLRKYLKNLYMDAIRELPAQQCQPEESIPELMPLNCRVSNFDGQRLNLLLPALALRHVFGGIATALELFRELTGCESNIRIVLTDSLTFDALDNPDFVDWRIASLDEADCAGRQIIAAGDRYGHTLAVGQGDRFIATAWWTAVIAREIQKWQMCEFALEATPRFLYLIQDYEPGFYPWSARYALADATYRDGDSIIALFNTAILRRYFEHEGYRFDKAYQFEPRLSVRLRQLRDKAMTKTREHRVLVYGRPSVARNAFQIIVEGVRRFISEHPENDWTFVSAGEAHPPIELGNGRMLNSVGKLTIDEYAQELGRCCIGISLMISPHPSYPPLEMAAFGMKVITNRYKTKNLSAFSPNIHSLDEVSPSALAIRLDELITSSTSTESDDISSLSSPLFKEYIQGKPVFSQLADTLRTHLLKGTSNNQS